MDVRGWHDAVACDATSSTRLMEMTLTKITTCSHGYETSSLTSPTLDFIFRMVVQTPKFHRIAIVFAYVERSGMNSVLSILTFLSDQRR